MTKGIYLIVGESGSGKTTIVDRLCNKCNGFTSIESYTTRPKRYENETGHTFITENEFDKLKNICAYIKYNGYRYCATEEQVKNNDLYILDKKGLFYFWEKYKGNKQTYVIYIHTPWHKRFSRMLKRGDGLKKTIKRILIDVKQFFGMKYYADLIVNNENIDIAATTIKSFITDKEKFGG